MTSAYAAVAHSGMDALAESDVADYEDADQMSRQLGEAVMSAFQGAGVTGMYVNPDGRLWTVSHARGHAHDGLTLTPLEVEGFLSLAAARLREVITRRSPKVQGDLPRAIFGGARLQGVIAPTTGAPVFVIRKHADVVFPLESYRERGELTHRHYDAICQGISDDWSIAVGGPVHSGKSTFLNAMIHQQVQQSPSKRLLVIEDLKEIRSEAINTTAMLTSQELDLEGCLWLAMRMDPQHIHVGEIRNRPKGAAFAMLDGWSTGHPGFCTIHSRHVEGTYERLGRLARRESGQDEGWMVADSVQMGIQITPTKGGRRITEVAKCEEYRNGRYILTPL